MSERWTPKIGKLTIPAKPVEDRVNHEAILNPLPKGTKVRVSHGENVLVEIVDHTSKEWGQTFWLEVALGRSWQPDSIAIDMADKWNVEILATPAVPTSTGKD